MAAGSSFFDVTGINVGFKGDGEATSEGVGKVRGVDEVIYKVLGGLGMGWTRVGGS